MTKRDGLRQTKVYDLGYAPLRTLLYSILAFSFPMKNIEKHE